MTDFERIKGYYRCFNEDGRLSADASGRFEYEMTMKILTKYMPEKGTVLDLGGASGAYAFPLAEMGYNVYLADLSEDLINIAKEKASKIANCNVLSCDVVNATDLSRYADGSFDAVLFMGPLYHLLEETERNAAVKEVYRVLKKVGIVFAAFIPYLSGSIGIAERLVYHPGQVDRENLKKVFETGKFVNAVKEGFQEGFYATSDYIEKLFADNGYVKKVIRSIRGFAYNKEDFFSNVRPDMKEDVIELIETTSEMKEIVEMCGHAMYVGVK